MPRTVRVYDEYAFGFSWVLEEGMQRSSHALVVDGRVWLVDPVAFDEALGRAAVGMHPMLRALPPRGLRSRKPRHLLMGHGAGVHGAAAAPGLEQAHARARRDIPHVLAKLPSLGS